MIWFRKTQGLDSSTMREIANEAGVSWSAESIVYRGQGIGYADGDLSDLTAIQDTAELLLGYRPVDIDPPDEPTQE